MRLRPPRSAQTRARFRLLLFCALGPFALVCATVVFVTTRSSLPGSANADAIAGFVGISVLVYSGMLIYLFASDYRPHRTLQVVVAMLFSAGASVSLYLAGVRTLHLSPPAAVVGSALATVAVFRFSLPHRRGERRRDRPEPAGDRRRPRHEGPHRSGAGRVPARCGPDPRDAAGAASAGPAGRGSSAGRRSTSTGRGPRGRREG